MRFSLYLLDFPSIYFYRRTAITVHELKEKLDLPLF